MLWAWAVVLAEVAFFVWFARHVARAEASAKAVARLHAMADTDVRRGWR